MFGINPHWFLMHGKSTVKVKAGFLLQFYKHRTTVQYKTISIRQFVLSNCVIRQTNWGSQSDPNLRGGGLNPLENFEKLDPKSCILSVSASVQIFSKDPGQTKKLYKPNGSSDLISSCHDFSKSIYPKIINYAYY